MLITFKFEFCGLTLMIDAHYETPEPLDWRSHEGWVIDEARHQGFDLDLDEMDIYEKLETAAQVAADNQHEPEDEQ